MAGSLADTYEAIVADHVFDLADMTQATNWTIKLTTTAPTDSTPGTPVGTGTWTNYADATVANGAAQWSRTGNVVTNDNVIDFGTATATGQVDVVGFDIYDGATRVGWGTFASTMPVVNGNPVYFAAGDLSITLD